MAKVKGEVLVATVTDVMRSGQLNGEGQIDVGLVCGQQDLILTLNPDDAKKLAEGLLHAVSLAGKSKK